MFPTDSEFTTLYSLFIVFLGYLVFMTYKSKRKGYYKINLVIYLLYTALFIVKFTNPDNFKYGSSLVMLLIPGFVVGIHIGVLLLVWLVRLAVKGELW
ncbi:hypothetical protein NBRC110019_15360 [Neptunitalea chrysea]|uniref:Uncharacterized protein n=1 Tax=Neptunitalea chrysea TaxID=1647581 RepID=A0A9W6B4P9_9FLAO|nr:hypothetical protein [Neptunitalea chrysea]GLB52496.1 hypothetical protein NBRC110019_15360 [Neptunitalea chrysea]